MTGVNCPHCDETGVGQYELGIYRNEEFDITTLKCRRCYREYVLQEVDLS